MKIIIGLGNPGKKYAHTRHNAGFMMIDKIKETCHFSDFEFNKKLNCEISIGNKNFCSLAEEENDKIILAKPQKFMNNSGAVVQTILDFYKLSPENIVVIHDDLDIALGEYKIVTDSRSAGHNGVQDIIEKIGTQKFKRIRIGIRTSLNAGNANLRSVPAEDFVLQKFTEKELEIIGHVLEKISEETPDFIK